MARHRAVSNRHRWRRSSAPSVVPVRRLPGIELVDAQTKLAHLVSPDELAAGRVRGDYLGFCRLRFLPASMVEPGCGPCQPCREQARS